MRKPLRFSLIQGTFIAFLLLSTIQLQAQGPGFTPGSEGPEYENQKSEWIKNHPEEYQKMTPEAVKNISETQPTVFMVEQKKLGRSSSDLSNYPYSFNSVLVGEWKIASEYEIPLDVEEDMEGDSDGELPENPTISLLNFYENGNFEITGDGKSRTGVAKIINSDLYFVYEDSNCRDCAMSRRFIYYFSADGNLNLQFTFEDEQGNMLLMLSFKKSN